ncbi:alpha-ketoglutarate-dependent dioxygenase AlkB family protein [Salinimicrobium sediminilitoris]|uniref:alpha-ketoglutarate-dependent dioxygenase AlkB family protein n=1 Tax=Salinimicrobium sediminilitoris TaxID=2876715 RepID=UPI001E3EEFFF|nr:alpha-ketoglutarate-dependent dioxygenase AlkB [Salinimicrobium sediminilitoris]MCC8358314.1 alpha-ketoglutarate-dependent dioxygenase AlkB [Salinimicrobium sediminilitoris]
MKSINYPANLLPADGESYYFGRILSEQEEKKFFEILLKEVDWKQDEVIIFGKRIVTKRMTGWYGEKEFEYTYSKITRKAKIWTPELVELKNLVEEKTGLKFNSCLLNLYHTGEEGMSWHSDAEAELGKQPAIASVSLGAQRRFVLKHKSSGEKIELQLEPGSLLLMAGETQKYWLHRLPKSKKIKEPRINLTFRNIKK